MSLDINVSMMARRHVRLIRQTEVAECGLACLAMIAGYYDLNLDLAVLRRRFQPSLRGATLKSLVGMADDLSLASRAVKLSLEALGKLHLPAILHWDMNHFVVVETVRKNKALIHNPEGSSRWITLAEVSNHFTGVALEFRPTADFEAGDQRERLRLSQLWSRMSGLKRALAQTLVLSIVMQTFTLALPYYMQVAIDRVLPAQDRDLLVVLALGFGLFTLCNGLASLLRSFVLLTAGTSLGYGIAVNVGRRLMRLPIAWFERRHVGDILSRFQSITPIRDFLTEGAVGVVIDGLLTLFILAIMLFYSVTLTFVALFAFVAYAAVRILLFPIERDAQEDAIMSAGREQSTMIESLRGVTTLRLFNREATRQALWQTRLSDAMNASFAANRITAWRTTANTLIFGIESVIAVWLAISYVIDGGFSVGMIFAFLAYKTQFVSRGAALIDQAIAFRMLRLHLERLADIALADVDASFEEASWHSHPLQGHVTLLGIGFQYSPTDPRILHDVELDIPPGSHVALTGSSGGGKTTLAKIMLGLLEPTEGEVRIDGVPLSRFGRKNFREQVGTVMQDDSLFAGTLAENIALFDDTPDMDRIVAAATAAAIHADIVAMPMAYETLVGDMGSALSGGQKQCLLLARALYRKPRLLVMDEGTSHLDPAREALVNAAVATLGITRIIIAHRMETILNAERVYAMAEGRLTDISTQFDAIRDQLAAPR